MDTGGASQLKEQGNQAFREKKWDEAIAFFTQALALEPNNEVYFSNRSAAFINIGQYPKALADANSAVEQKPEWGRGYQRRGGALYHLERFEESVEAYTKAVELEPSNAIFQGALISAQKASKISKYAPQGLLAQVPITYKDNAIAWEVLDELVDWYINSGSAALWAGSPASEISHLNNDEVFQFTKRILDRCGPRNFPVFASAKPQANLEDYATEIKRIHALGVTTIIIDLNVLGAAADAEATITQNLSHLTSLLGDIPIGIYEAKEPYHRTLSPAMVKSIAALPTVWFSIDTSSGASHHEAKINSIGNDSKHSFRMYATQNTLLGHSLVVGFHGFAGVGSSFLPRIYAHVLKKKETPTQNPLLAFLSLSEPTLDCFHPWSIKIFLGFHLENIKDRVSMQPESRYPYPETTKGMEETIIRLTHLHEAAQFIIESLDDPSKKKKPDSSVLL